MDSILTVSHSPFRRQILLAWMPFNSIKYICLNPFLIYRALNNRANKTRLLCQSRASFSLSALILFPASIESWLTRRYGTRRPQSSAQCVNREVVKSRHIMPWLIKWNLQILIVKNRPIETEHRTWRTRRCHIQALQRNLCLIREMAWLCLATKARLPGKWVKQILIRHQNCEKPMISRPLYYLPRTRYLVKLNLLSRFRARWMVSRKVTCVKALTSLAETLKAVSALSSSKLSTENNLRWSKIHSLRQAWRLVSAT